MRRRSLIAAPVLAAPFVAEAQSLFGEKPIRMIVPVAVAGASDIVARIVADAMVPLLGRQIVPENIAGAGSTLGVLVESAIRELIDTAFRWGTLQPMANLRLVGAG